tara:strand:- start:94 stop:327 length:234 start_codon:yes stop_codon:yes gene_type:complete
LQNEEVNLLDSISHDSILHRIIHLTAEFGILMGIGGIIITVIGFFIAFKIATYEKTDKEEPDNPITEFWKDFPGNKK